MEKENKGNGQEIILFIIVSGFLTILQNSFFSYFSFKGGIFHLGLAFGLSSIYLEKRGNCSTSLFKAGVIAFFSFLFYTSPFFVFLGATLLSFLFFKFALGVVREKNTIIFFFLCLVSLFIYQQLFTLFIFLGRDMYEFRIIGTREIFSVLITTLACVLFYVFQKKIREI